MSAGTASGRRWDLRTVAEPLVERYRAEGWWTDDTLGDMVAAAMPHVGGEDFEVHSAVRPWRGTLAEVDATARSVAASLQAMGISAGDVVVFQLPNWMEAAATFWGAAHLGAVVVPVVHFYGPKEVGYVVDAIDADVVVTPSRFGARDYLADYSPLLGRRGKPWFVVGEDDPLPAGARAFADLLGSAPLDEAPEVDPGAPAVIGFTSGTTRDPKGVVHSHRTMGCEVRQLDARTPPGAPPNVTGAPVGHFIGMLSGLLMPLLRRQPIHLVDVWDPGEVLRIMRERHVGVGGGATYFITSLLDHPDFTDEHLALMPYIGMGGSVVPVAVTERMTALGICVYRSYGSTEHPSVTASAVDDPPDKRLATDGCPLAGAEVRLDDRGEIATRGPDLFLGYTDADLTASVFDEDGWYRTGDVGTLDEDGYLTIRDRISDVIIRGGENISAQEVEDLLLGLPSVAEAVVVAVPDDRLGERAAALVRMLPGAPAPSLDDVRAHLRAAGLSRQKWPESVDEMTDFPRTPTGKVQKYVLRARLRDGAFGTV